MQLTTSLETCDRPLTTTAPSNQFVGIDQAVTYGDSQNPILDSTAGIIDTGTTLLLLATGEVSRHLQNAFD